MKFLSYWFPVLLYACAVFYLSSLPGIAAAATLPDYLVHSAEYLGLTLLIVRALNEGFLRPIPITLHLVAVGISVLYAVSDEIHQLYVPRRTASVKDVLSDTLGAILAVGLAEAVQRFRSNRRRPLSIILYTRHDCHLCHDARQVLSDLENEVPMLVSEIDIDSDPVLSERYGAEVPVIVAEGVKVSKLAPDGGTILRRLLKVTSPSR